MSLGISTSWFGFRPFAVDALLDLQRDAGVREIAVAAESVRPLPPTLGEGLRAVGARVAACEAMPARHGEAATSLLSMSAEAVRRAMATIGANAAEARAVGCDLVVIRLGTIDVDRGPERDAELSAKLRLEGQSEAVTKLAMELAHEVERRHDALLERVCRALFACMKTAPDIRFAIATPRSALGFPTLATCRTVLDEFRGKPLGYWHDAAAARMLELYGLAQPSAWSGEHASRTLGATMTDVAGSETRLPPGAGELDFKSLRETLPSAMPVVLDVDPKFGMRELQQAVKFLRGMGW